METKILECKNLSKTIGKKQILKNVELEISEGDILGFIGPNGAGKTTTIKLILGLQKITNGYVKINGYDIKENFEKAIEKVGTIVENPDLYMYMSGYKNLKLIANLYKDVDQKRVEEVIKITGLENRIKHYPTELSGGEQQRVSIARAIAKKPKVVLCDEPTGALDNKTGIMALKTLRDLNRDFGTSIVLITHSKEISKMADTVIKILNGEVVERFDIENPLNPEYIEW